jgi:GTP-binding protein Era
MLLLDQHPDNKNLMVSLLGAPNVGKSSLINNLLGMDLTVVTKRPQTTRNRFHCVTVIDRTEIVFVDTPGMHRSGHEFNKRLNEQARDSIEGVDVNLILIDLSTEIVPQIKDFIFHMDDKINELGPSWLVFNKADLIENAEELPLGEIFEKAKELIPSLEKYFVISTKDQTNINKLTGALCDIANPGAHMYPDGDISNRNERFFVTEYVREQAFHLLKDELPYELAVLIEEYKEVKEKTEKSKIISHISAAIIVNRPSQRAIVVGKSGAMIKEIGTRARKKIEALLGGQVHLNLHVKVSPKWFSNNFVLEEIGLPRAKDSNRVWRKKD